MLVGLAAGLALLSRGAPGRGACPAGARRARRLRPLRRHRAGAAHERRPAGELPPRRDAGDDSRAGGQSFFRIDPTRLSATWQPSWAAVAGLESVVGTYNPLGLANYNRYWEETFRRHDSPRYDLLNIRYVMLPPNESPAGEGKFREVQRAETLSSTRT